MIEWTLGLTLADVERLVILKAFRFFQGNKTKTAAALDIAIRTLDAKLEQYGVKPSPHGVMTYAIPVTEGVPVEPAQQVSQESPVPVQQRDEIQEVLRERHAEADSTKRLRRGK